MKLTLIMKLILALVVLFFAVPFVPTSILMLSDTIIVRFILLVILIASVNVTPLVGILTFLVLAHLFIQRNQRKLQIFQTVPENENIAVESIQTPSTAPPQPAFQRPSEKSVQFMPQDDSGENAFHAVAESLNEKEVLPTETVDGSDKAIAQLFRWVNPDIAQDS
jgi:hypothetical protein